jgi:SAM-dependent methyltransferase
VDVAAFVTEQGPAAPARVLEVGCGAGELARALAARGYSVVAIDPRAPAGELFQAVELEQFTDPGPFDAVVASRSLHHIADLGGALDKIVGLLAPGGRLVVHEHAWERFDERTARWYLQKRHATRAERPHSHEACVAHWRADHRGLHGYGALRKELDRRFDERFFAWAPYLYGELGEAVEQEERALIEAGAIQATGFYYVGERSASSHSGQPPSSRRACRPAARSCRTASCA